MFAVCVFLQSHAKKKPVACKCTQRAVISACKSVSPLTLNQPATHKSEWRDKFKELFQFFVPV